MKNDLYQSIFLILLTCFGVVVFFGIVLSDNQNNAEIIQNVEIKPKIKYEMVEIEGMTCIVTKNRTQYYTIYTTDCNWNEWDK